MARVTPCVLCFWFTWDSSRVPVNPRETLNKKLPIVTPCIEPFVSVCVFKSEAEYLRQETNEDAGVPNNLFQWEAFLEVSLSLRLWL